MSLILILDDRGTNRKILAQLALSVEPAAETVPFGNPLHALAWLDSHRPDLVISDFRMPHMDGAEVAARIRSKPTGADVPIVIVTAYDDVLFRRRALEAGATDFVISPVDHDEFRSRVRNLLALRQHQVKSRAEAQELARHLEASERSRRALIRESREALAQLIDTVPAMISAADRDGRLIFVNGAQAAVANATPAELVGHRAARIMGEERAERSLAADAEVLATGHPFPGFEEKTTDRSGMERTLFTTKAPLRDGDDNLVAVLTTSIDITDRKRAEEQVRFLAGHDPLTGLPNRSLLGERLRELCARGRRGDTLSSLLLLDLDRFKGVNDALGPEGGDQLLRDVAARLAEVVGEGGLVARLGGDEFAILQEGLGSAQDPAHLATRVIEALDRPFVVMERNLSISGSIGITLHPTDAGSADELLRNADMAMYRAKAAGRGAYRFFDNEMDRAAREALQLEADLRLAVEREEFELVWQPQVRLKTGRISGAEALLRWRHPTRGLLSPGTFLPAAEETGLLTPITQWVLLTVCRQGVAWAGGPDGGMRVAANISPSLFREGDVLGYVATALAESGLNPQLLDIELTESVLMDNVDDVAETLHQLRGLGVSLSIDDFGIGYSSLTYAKRFPAQRLKVDRSFVAQLVTNKVDAAIVGSVISLGHSLGMEVVAEGVEKPEQIEALRALGCDEIQGYFVSRPISAEALTGMLSQAQQWPALA